MTVFELHNQGNTEAQQKAGVAYLLAQSAVGKAKAGVLSGLTVSQTTTASGSVLVAAGGAAVQAAVLDGASLLVNDTTATVDVLTANPMGSLPRNDLIVLDAATMTVRPIIGTPNATPADPTVPTSAVVLARIRNAANATTIPTSAIDDLRPYTAPAGAPIPVRNSTERDALTPVDGMRVYRLDTKVVETYGGGVWRPGRFAWATGTVTAPNQASGNTSSFTVTFPAGLFTAPPVMPTPNPSSSRITCCAINITATGCTIQASNWSPDVSTGGPIRWTAEQATG